MARETVELQGIEIDVLDLEGLLERVRRFVRDGGRHRILHVNVHTLNQARRDPACRRALQRADLVYCDGEGVRLGARLLGRRLPQRMTGADWIHDLCALAQAEGFSLYFLGGEPGMAERAGQRLQGRYPTLRVAGCHHGYFEKKAQENEEVVRKVNKSAPDILLVGFGTPLQERWIEENFEWLRVPVVWAMGATLDYVAGKVPRAPEWMYRHGLEWLFRLTWEPGRMWRRYLVGNALFLLRILRERIAREGHDRLPPP